MKLFNFRILAALTLLLTLVATWTHGPLIGFIAGSMVAQAIIFQLTGGALCANTTGTLNGTAIAQQALSTLLARFPVLSKISTDFSGENLLWGQSLIIKLASAQTAQDYHTTNGYVPADTTSADTATIVMNKHKHVTYQVTVQEANSTRDSLILQHANNAAYALGNAILGDLMGLVLAAAFTNASTVAAADFDRDALIDINKALNDRNVPDMNRFALLNNAYYAALEKDLVVVANNYNPASNTIESGILSDVDGTEVQRYSGMPANGENLTGFVTTADALALATRPPEIPCTERLPVPGTHQIVTEPNSGLSVLMVEYVDLQKGACIRSLRLMYGVAVGRAAALQRIKSA